MQVAVAGKKNDVGRDGGRDGSRRIRRRPAAQREAARRVAVDPRDFAALEDAGPGLRGSAGEPVGELERVEMAGAAVEPPAEIVRRPGRRGHLLAVEPGDGLIAVVVAERVDIGALVVDQPRLVDGLDQPRPPVAVDAVARDEAEGQRLRLLGEPPQRPGLVPTELRREPVLVAALAGVELAAVPSRGAPADAVGLDHHRVDARLGEMERRRQPGVAAADDGDVSPHVLAEAREGRGRIGRSGIEGRRVGQVHGAIASRPARPSPRNNRRHVCRGDAG